MLTSIKEVIKHRLSPDSRRRVRELIGAFRARQPENQAASELRKWEDKIREIGGVVDDAEINVSGIRLINCYRQFALVVAENLYHQHYKFSLKGSWIAIDVGANAGVSALYLAQNEHINQIFAFEPVAPIYKMLERNLKLNPKLAEKVQSFNCGLGSRDETLSIPYCRDHAMSVSSKGIYNRYFEKIDSMENIAIKDSSIAIGGILADHPDKKVLLKMDCEGAEFEIIPHLASRGFLSRIDVVMVEFHDKDPEELIAILDEAGFACFTEWARRDLNIGMIKGVRVGT